MIRLAVAIGFTLAAIAVPHSYWAAPQAAWAIGTPADAALEHDVKPLSADERRAIESYLRRVFGNARVRLDPQPPEADVYVGDALVGVVYPYQEDGGRTFYFEMAIYDTDLAPGAPVRSRR